LLTEKAVDRLSRAERAADSARRVE
jgi:hypothetical protein